MMEIPTVRSKRLFLVVAVLAGCQPAPASHVTRPAAAASAAPVQPASKALAKTTQLAHDGGIVYGTSLSGISDPGKRQVAAAVSTSLGADLRAERTMRDAELLVGGSWLPAPAAYGLLSEEEEEPDMPEEEASLATSEGEPDDEEEQDEEERAESEALQAWSQQSPEEREHAREAFERRKAALVAKLAPSLTKKAQLFEVGAEQALVTAAGGKEITTALSITRPHDRRTITVVRKFDVEGTEIQSAQRLEGTVGAVAYAAKRTRTLRPDGSVRVFTESMITIGGEVRVVRWEKTIASDGVITATGTLRRPDGTVVALSASGQEGGAETVVASDAASAVTIKVETSAVTGVALTTVDAGIEGSATFELDADEEEEEEDEEEEAEEEEEPSSD